MVLRSHNRRHRSAAGPEPLAGPQLQGLLVHAGDLPRPRGARLRRHEDHFLPRLHLELPAVPKDQELQGPV